MSYKNSIAQKATHTFALADSVFLLDGKPFQMISGEMHYPRVLQKAWCSRMKTAKAMGLNTIGGKQLAPLQINHGGNILMVQIENEYGSYGSDKEYLSIN